jgi:DNA-binding MurR/RpiR family transcriptional regulator
VGISDTYVSPLSRECDEVFLASIECTSFGASYTAPTALINALLAAVGHYRRAQTLALVQRLIAPRLLLFSAGAAKSMLCLAS